MSHDDGQPPLARTETSEYYIREDGIVVQRVVSSKKQSRKDAEHNAATYNELVGQQRRLLMVDMVVPFSSEPSVRKFYASEEAGRCVIALAMVTHSLATTLIGNFFLNLGRPPYPCKMFTEIDDAAKWLLECKMKDSAA